MDEDADYYRILEIDPSADEATIKRAAKANYKRLALKHHPDKNPGDEAATARFQKVQHAFDVLSDDGKRREYNEERAGRRREAAAREAREAEEQQQQQRRRERQRERQRQHDRQRRQQEDQRRREEEQQRREEQYRREEEARRQRDEQRRQDEQQRAREGDEVQEEAEKQPGPGVAQPEQPKSFLKLINDFVQSAAPAPIRRLFESVQWNWTGLLLLGFILVWIAGSLRGASPLPAPVDEMLKELRIGPSLAEVQVRFAENHNLPYELQVLQPLVGELIEPLNLNGPFYVEQYWDYSADAVDGVFEAYLATDRLITEVEKTIMAAISQLDGIMHPHPPFYYRLLAAHTTASSRRTDKEARQMLIPVADSIYETLDKAVMILRTTEHSLSMLLETLDNIVVSIYGVRIGKEQGKAETWAGIFTHLSPSLFRRSQTGSADFYGDARQAREGISSAKATLMALQDQLLIFQRALQDAPLTTLENTLDLCARALHSDWHELRTGQMHTSRTRKEQRRGRRTAVWFTVPLEVTLIEGNV